MKRPKKPRRNKASFGRRKKERVNVPSYEESFSQAARCSPPCLFLSWFVPQLILMKAIIENLLSLLAGRLVGPKEHGLLGAVDRF
jgi:hypothetical protein